jgi:uncharacterized repeat protein (TIGR03803 family)
MRHKFMMGANQVALTIVLMLPLGPAPGGQTEVLYKFKGGNDGGHPTARLVFDAVGNLYGTTGEGGGQTCYDNAPCGTVFKLAPTSNGSWRQSVLYRFTGGRDGMTPQAGLIFDGAGNLYGTTIFGGGSTGCTGGCGTVFELTPNSDGSWTESVLYRFCQLTECADGEGPYGPVVLDGEGNLYGTTPGGGASGEGVAFRLSPNSGGGWTETVLHSFSGFPKDGSAPSTGLIFDMAGNLYGGTGAGGALGYGTVFKLTPNSNGGWTESLLHSFGGPNFAGPSTLKFDELGNLYGTTANGGTSKVGTVFKLTPKANGSWKESVLHNFAQDAGANPYTYAGLTFDTSGNLYGTTVNGGPANGGAVFKLVSRSGGGWTYTMLHAFLGNPALHPYGGLVSDQSGKHLYGTAEACAPGERCRGVVFEITPNAKGNWTESVAHGFGGMETGTVASLIFDTSEICTVLAGASDTARALSSKFHRRLIYAFESLRLRIVGEPNHTAGGPDNRARLTLEGAPSKLRLGGVLLSRKNTYLSPTLFPAPRSCQFGNRSAVRPLSS